MFRGVLQAKLSSVLSYSLAQFARYTCVEHLGSVREHVYEVTI